MKYTLELDAKEVLVLKTALQSNINLLQQLGCADVASDRRELLKKLEHIAYHISVVGDK